MASSEVEFEKQITKNKIMKSTHVTLPSAPPLKEYIQEIYDIWNTRVFTNSGSKVLKLEEKLCDYLGVDHISLFSNGHAALEAALSTLDHKGEIITTPFTFASTMLAILRNNHQPVFCDINASDYTINPSLIEDLITEKTCAIVPVHIYGNMCNTEEIEAIGRKYGIPVIYDGAQAFGVTKNGVGVGNYGDMCVFSFHATKVFHTVEGGAVAYKNPALKKYFASHRNFGLIGSESVCIGANLKMSELHAAMGLCNLKHVDKYIKNRAICVAKYNDLLANTPGLHILQIPDGIKHNYSYYPIRITPDEYGFSRDDVAARLTRHGICTCKYFSPLVSQFSIYNHPLPVGNTPMAELIANQILILPLYADLQTETIEYICSKLPHIKNED